MGIVGICIGSAGRTYGDPRNDRTARVGVGGWINSDHGCGQLGKHATFIRNLAYDRTCILDRTFIRNRAIIRQGHTGLDGERLPCRNG